MLVSINRGLEHRLAYYGDQYKTIFCLVDGLFLCASCALVLLYQRLTKSSMDDIDVDVYVDVDLFR